MMYDYKKDLDNPNYDDGTHTEIDERGTKIWRNDEGQYHREEDKPAVINPNESIEWWINGNCHRENDKPAIIRPDGTMSWVINDKIHRENDKPSIIFSSGHRAWLINDKRIEPESKHYIAAIEEDPSYVNHEQFEEFIKDNKKDISVKDQELILKYNPRLAQYILNLNPKFKQTKKAASFGLFS